MNENTKQIIYQTKKIKSQSENPQFHSINKVLDVIEKVFKDLHNDQALQSLQNLNDTKNFKLTKEVFQKMWDELSKIQEKVLSIQNQYLNINTA